MLMNVVVYETTLVYLLHILGLKYIANMLQKLVCYVKPKKKKLRPWHLHCTYVNMGTITE